MKNWKLKTGDFLFKHRSFTPVPVMILVFLLFKPRDVTGYNIIVNLVGIMLSLLGESIRVMAVGFSFAGTSGRESYLRADSLNTTGIYSIVRNPLYIGNFLIFTGLALVFANPLAMTIFALFLWVQYYFIILSEENFLHDKYGPEYEAYCERVRRVVPRFDFYKKNRNPFNLKKVVFKENDSLFNLLVIFLLILLYKERNFSGKIADPLVYVIPGVVLVSAYIVIKILKKRPGKD